jgi:hypothetical protein
VTVFWVAAAVVAATYNRAVGNLEAAIVRAPLAGTWVAFIFGFTLGFLL